MAVQAISADESGMNSVAAEQLKVDYPLIWKSLEEGGWPDAECRAWGALVAERRKLNDREYAPIQCVWCGWKSAKPFSPQTLDEVWLAMQQHITTQCEAAPHMRMAMLLEEFSASLKRVGGYLVTALPENQPEWLEGIANVTDEADAVIAKWDKLGEGSKT